MPFNPNAKSWSPAKANDPSTWSDFQTALNHVWAGRAMGMGIMTGNELICIDLDYCINDGVVEDWAMQIVNDLNTYTEISMSGSGLHIFLQSSFNHPRRRKANGRVEIYPDNHYIALTGNVLQSYTGIRHIDAEVIAAIHNRHILSRSNEDYFQAGLKNTKFHNLYYGIGVDPNQNETDMALWGQLAYWCNKDPKLMEDKFLNSPYIQTKDEAHQKKIYDRIDNYVRSGINVAISNCTSTAEEDDVFNVPVFRKGSIHYRKDGEVRSVDSILENFEVIVKNLGLDIKFNLAAKRIEFDGKYLGSESYIQKISELRSICKKYRMSVSKQDATDNIISIANRNSYNPVIDYLKACAAQNNSRKWLERLLRLVEFDTDDSEKIAMYQAVVEKWLIQCVAMAYNSEKHVPVNGEFVLILKGRQGVGKTTFFRALCSSLPEYFYEGAYVDSRNKDTVIQATSYWITELGEFGTTSARDMDGLKAFVTAARDIYRKPYGAGTSDSPRTTSLCATVNNASFLRDDENRRFPVVPVRRINYRKLSKVNMDAVWGYIVHQYRHAPNAFRLTAVERAFFQAESRAYHQKNDEYQSLLDLLDLDSAREWKDEQCEWFTATQIAVYLGQRILGSKFTNVDVGKALVRMGFSKDDKYLQSKQSGGTSRYRIPKSIKG